MKLKFSALLPGMLVKASVTQVILKLIKTTAKFNAFKRFLEINYYNNYNKKLITIIIIMKLYLL